MRLSLTFQIRFQKLVKFEQNVRKLLPYRKLICEGFSGYRLKGRAEALIRLLIVMQPKTGKLGAFHQRMYIILKKD